MGTETFFTPPQPDSACDPFAAASAARKAASQAQDDKSKPGPNEKTESAFGKALIGQDSKPGDPPPAQQADGVKFVEVENPDLVPVTLDGYTIPVEGADPKLTAFLTSTAHELNMTRKQTSLLAQKYDQMVKAHMTEQAKATEENSKAVTAELTTLWGNDFDGNSRLVQESTKTLSDAQFTALVQKLLHAHFASSRQT
jgi:hypothetical protein